MIRTLKSSLLIIASAGLAAAGGMALSRGGAPAASSSFSAEDVYLDKCSVCHGKDGAGKTAKGKKVKAKDVRETIKTMSEDEMIKILEDGKGKDMDSWKKEFTQDEIKALVEYYRTLAK